LSYGADFRTLFQTTIHNLLVDNKINVTAYSFLSR